MNDQDSLGLVEDSGYEYCDNWGIGQNHSLSVVDPCCGADAVDGNRNA